MAIFLRETFFAKKWKKTFGKWTLNKVNTFFTFEFSSLPPPPPPHDPETNNLNDNILSRTTVCLWKSPTSGWVSVSLNFKVYSLSNVYEVWSVGVIKCDGKVQLWNTCGNFLIFVPRGFQLFQLRMYLAKTQLSPINILFYSPKYSLFATVSFILPFWLFKGSGLTTEKVVVSKALQSCQVVLFYSLVEF